MVFHTFIISKFRVPSNIVPTLFDANIEGEI